MRKTRDSHSVKYKYEKKEDSRYSGVGNLKSIFYQAVLKLYLVLSLAVINQEGFLREWSICLIVFWLQHEDDLVEVSLQLKNLANDDFNRQLFVFALVNLCCDFILLTTWNFLRY